MVLQAQERQMKMVAILEWTVWLLYDVGLKCTYHPHPAYLLDKDPPVDGHAGQAAHGAQAYHFKDIK